MFSYSWKNETACLACICTLFVFISLMVVLQGSELHKLVCFWWHQILLQIKETAERILAVDRAAAMIEEMLKLGQNSQSISSASPSALVNGLKVHSFITSLCAWFWHDVWHWNFLLNQVLTTCVFLGFDADPSLNIVARIRGPNVSPSLLNWFV